VAVILRQTIARCLHELPTDEAKTVEDTLCREISREFGGTRIYVAMTDRVDHDQVRAMYNGWNVRGLMAHFRISRSRVYQILNER
jgi:Mor family transcriptional regulator